LKGLIQRVKSASVVVEGKKCAQISRGLLLFVGVEKEDDEQNIQKMARKVINYRVFADADGKMNQNLADINGELLVVSQFTLVADTSKGNRPGFSKGASPEHGKLIYDKLIKHITETFKTPQTGVFGADMAVSLLNDGPVTFWIET